MIQTNARVIAETIFHLDMEPNAIIKPSGIEKASVTKNILRVSAFLLGMGLIVFNMFTMETY